jgi:hypothetical protein
LPAYTFGGSGPALTAHGSLDLKQEIQIQIILVQSNTMSSTFSLLFFLIHQFLFKQGMLTIFHFHNMKGKVLLGRLCSLYAAHFSSKLWLMKLILEPYSVS